MSKVITLNINSGENTVETLQINTAGSEAVRIAAQNGVNYELIDAATQFAPENLTVLRQGDDLLIAFEGSLINEPDLIIEDYYQQSKDNPLIGLNEDGQYYAYVPEAGADVNALTMLAEQMPSGQALSGDAVAQGIQGIPLWPIALVPLAFLVVDDSSGSTEKTNFIDPEAIVQNTELVGDQTQLKLDVSKITAGDVLQFDGDLGDRLEINLTAGDWAKAGTTTVGDNNYSIWEHYNSVDGAYTQILVQDGIVVI
ncbi:hypothetical protein L0B52_04200 [Suttonella sp. R2A3]|uniref:hypothetical protein n=1 Tax=Suttonella sp. R2A3 TaxID=2908648 RepID=UPI001F4206FC|nr:hypothetical protein [Suttonella sp. R2A3]UJF25354.1 hypothetical protein L0B52_04200 [Suttonella sp. R2A3]